ncbi:MAG: HNH endonuclease [Phocaeicola vulgatus]
MGKFRNGKIIHHIDHNPLNNSIENLEAVSKK